MQAPQWQMARLMDFLATSSRRCCTSRPRWASPTPWPSARKPVPSWRGSSGPSPGALHRVLRGLATEDVVTEADDGRFALTPAGELLARRRPRVAPAGRCSRAAQLYHDAAGRMLAGVRGEGVPYELANGAPFFDDLAEHPEREAAFQASMAGRSDQEVGDVVDAYDLADRPAGRRRRRRGQPAGGDPADRARADRRALRPPRGRAGRRRPGCAARAWQTAASSFLGDFFASVPAGADAYVLSRVLHDWDDEDAGRILARVRAAMGDGSRLLVVEAILPEACGRTSLPPSGWT